MVTTRHNPAGPVLLATFLVFLGGYFFASYVGHREPLSIQEKSLTIHDDLLAIDGRHNGNKIAVGKFGLILLTKDGGKTWQQRPSGTTKTLDAVSFADHEHGFIVGSGGTVLATADGGVTWQAQSSGTKDHLLGVYAVTPENAFAVGAFGTLLSTSDGGRNWRKHEFNWDTLIERIVKETGLVEPNLNAVCFSSPELGWIVGEFGLVLHTKDGGESWTSQRYGSDLPQLYAVKMLDSGRGWAMGQVGSLIQTSDSGQHWSPVGLESKRDLYHISLESDRGVIVGEGIVLVSNDGGSNWKPMRLDLEDRWLSGVALKSSEAIAVGQSGTRKLLNLDSVASETGNKAQ